MKFIDFFASIRTNMHKRILVFLFVLLATMLVLGGSAFAGKFDYDIKTNFDIQADKTTQANYIIDVKNNVSTPSPSSITVPVVGTDIKNIEAAYADGDKLTATYSEDTQTIRLETTRQQSGQDEQWSVSLNYDTNFGTTLGNSFIAQLPVLDFGELDVVKHSVIMSADLKLGVAVERGPKSNNSQIVAGKQVVKWVNNKGPLKQSVALQFGENGVAEIEIRQNLKNDSWWWNTKIVTLPPDTNQQQVFLLGVEPKPSHIRLDVDGNIILEYNMRPFQSMEVIARAELVVNNFTYSLDSKELLNDIPQELKDRYTESTDIWQGGDVNVENLETTPVIEIIENVYGQVQAMDFEGDSSYDKSKNTADKLVGELRALGIPARTVLGKTYLVEGEIRTDNISHAWSEAYSPGVGWLSLDASSDQGGNSFGFADVSHTGLVLRGINDDFPPEQLDMSYVAYIEGKAAPEIPEMIPQLRATNYMLIPGIAMQTIEVTMPPGVIVDGAGVQVEGQDASALGSLAPLQVAANRSFVFAASAFTSSNVVYGLISDSTIPTPLAQTSSTVNYLPMLILIGLGLLIALIVYMVRRKRSKKGSKIKATKHNVTYATENDGGSIEKDNLIPTASNTKQDQAGNTEAASDTMPSEQPKAKKGWRRKKSKSTPTEIR